MIILVTGLGVTGKSSLLQWLKTFLHLIQETIILDLDYEREKLPSNPSRIDTNVLYILEDVHGPTQNAVIPLAEYSLVLYMLPSWFTHLQYWIGRMVIWYKNGRYAWDADKGKGTWAGTNKARDWRNLPGIIRYFLTHFPKRSRTLEEDFIALKTAGVPTYLVIPQGKGKNISFRFKKF